jgi:hypothetical protein
LLLSSPAAAAAAAAAAALLMLLLLLLRAQPSPCPCLVIQSIGCDAYQRASSICLPQNLLSYIDFI